MPKFAPEIVGALSQAEAFFFVFARYDRSACRHIEPILACRCSRCSLRLLA